MHLLVAAAVSASVTLGTAITAGASAPPAVYAVDPTTGPTSGGTAVAIFGSGFAHALSVQFGPNRIAQVCPAPPPGGPCFNIADDTRIFTTSTSGTAGTIDVTVTTSAGTSPATTGDHFTYVAPTLPAVNAIDPRQGTAAGGTGVQVFGSGFSSVTTINFGSTALSCSSAGFSATGPTSLSATRVRTTTSMGPLAPSGGGGFSPCNINSDNALFVNSPPGTAGTTVDVTVVNPAGTSPTGPGARFSFVAPIAPVVNAVGPNHGSAAGGDNVQIFGSGLSGATTVSFGSATVNRCPGTSPSRLTNSRSTTRSALRTVLGGGGGGGPSCFFPSGNDNQMNLQSPAGSVGTVHVTVTTPAGTSAASPANQFTYDPIGVPAVYGLDPNHGSAAGGSNVNISGSGFTGATAVHFGATSLPPCTGPGACFFLNGDAFINVFTPPGTAGTTVDVTVTTPLGTSSSGTTIPGDKFTFDTASVPVLNAIDPTHGPTAGNTQMSLYGSGFSGATSLHFGATAVLPCPQSGACFGVNSDNQIFLNTPSQSSTGSVAVTVTTPVGTSGSISFTYDPSPVPTVIGVSPNSGPTTGGKWVTISGTGLSGATAVTFGTNGANFYSAFGSDGIIFAQTPTGIAATVDVRVTSPAGTSAITAGDHYTYATPSAVVPTVTGVGPATGPSGSTVDISGSGFTTATGVTFGAGHPATSFSVVFGSDNLIQATSPAGSGTVDIQVTTPAGTSTVSANDRFTYGSAPAGPNVYGLDPNHGTSYGGTNVSVFGSGFTGASSVTVGTAPALSPCSPGPQQPCFNLNGDSSINVNTPAGLVGPADVRVTVSGVTSPLTNADRYTYETPAAPVVGGIDPRRGSTAGGSFGLGIYGSGLSGATSVSVGTTVLGPCSSSTFGSCFQDVGGDTQLNINGMPPGTAGTVHITVTTPSGTSATSSLDQFTYFVPPAPTVTRVSPNTGGSAGGTIVFITGTDLGGATQVSFGTNLPFNWFNQGAGVIQAYSPPGTASITPVDVTVTTASGTSVVSAADHFTYFQSPAPAITAVAPSSGVASGGTNVLITGTNLGGANSVSFGGNVAFGFFFNGPDNNLIQATAPPGTASATPVDVTVTTPAGTSPITSADHFTYTVTPAPTVSAVSPATGPASGGTQVYISGNYIQNATGVNFGTAASQFGFFSPAPNVLQATSPPGTASITPVDVTVTTPSGTSPTNANDHFTYTGSLAPVVVAVSPASGPSATAVWISGSNLDTATAVQFGGASHQSEFFGAWTPGVIRANSPPAAASITPVDITVVTPAGTSATSAADHYTYTAGAAPAITVVGPSIAQPGTVIEISGTALGGTTSVSFGSTPAPNFFVRSDNMVRVTVPAGSGTVDVRATTVVGTTPITAADIFTYPGSLSVGGVSPNSGPTAGGTNVTVTGSGFTGATAVNFGATPGVSVVVISDTQLTVTSPAGAGTVDITVVTSAGTSAISLADQFNYGGVYSRVSNRQYTLANSDGTTWIDLDSTSSSPLTMTVTPSTSSQAIISGNVDLWTSQAGYNQDLGINIAEASSAQYPGNIVAWKESGGFAGTFSPNAAYVQTVFPMTAGTTYHIKLQWKANKNAAGATIWAGAGPWPGSGSSFSPSRLSVALVPAAGGPVNTAVDTHQLTVNNSDGNTWTDMDSTSATPLSLTVTPTVNSMAVLSGNSDLWTSSAGFNQDIGIYVQEANATQYPSNIVAWKESGGFAGTFSPNAAFVQTVFPMTAGTTYHIKLQWKANKNAAGATIWAGAGPWPGTTTSFSPTRLTALLVPTTSGAAATAVDTRQSTLANSDGNTWTDIDSTSATPLTLTLTPASNCVAILSGNADLWTSSAGFNQDVGIYVQEANAVQFPSHIIGWKESGGFAGTFSPNAAFVQTIFPMNGGTTYHVKLQWKTNKNAPGATIWAGAGPWPSTGSTFSPTRLTALLSC